MRATELTILFLRMNCNENLKTDLISKSDSQGKPENEFIEDPLEIEPAKTEVVKTEIYDFDFTEKYDLPQIIAEKRKNREMTEIEPKKFKEEFVVFEECHQPKTEPNDEESDDKDLDSAEHSPITCYIPTSTYLAPTKTNNPTSSHAGQTPLIFSYDSNTDYDEEILNEGTIICHS